MKYLLPVLLILGSIVGSFFVGKHEGIKQLTTEINALKPDTVYAPPETTYVPYPVYKIKEVPAVILVRSDTSYTARLDTMISGASLAVEYLHPEMKFNIDLQLPPKQIIRDTVRVTFPPLIVIEKETNWYLVGVAAVLGYVTYDVLNGNR